MSVVGGRLNHHNWRWNEHGKHDADGTRGTSLRRVPSPCVLCSSPKQHQDQVQHDVTLAEGVQR